MQSFNTERCHFELQFWGAMGSCANMGRLAQRQPATLAPG